MPLPVDELSIMLGRIEAKLESIEELQKEERASAERHRSSLTLVIAAQSTATQALTARVNNLAEDFNEVRSLAFDYRDNREQAKGAAKALTFFRILIVGCATAIGGIITWLATLSHGPK